MERGTFSIKGLATEKPRVPYEYPPESHKGRRSKAHVLLCSWAASPQAQRGQETDQGSIGKWQSWDLSSGVCDPKPALVSKSHCLKSWGSGEEWGPLGLAPGPSDGRWS